MRTPPPYPVKVPKEEIESQACYLIEMISPHKKIPKVMFITLNVNLSMNYSNHLPKWNIARTRNK